MTTTPLSPIKTTVFKATLSRMGLLAAGVAAAINALVYTAARAGGVTFLVPQQPGAAPMQLPVAMVVITSAAGALAATLALALLRRWLGRRVALFPLIGGVGLILSLGAPLSLSAADCATRATLVLMHLLAGISIIGLLSGLTRHSSA